MMGTRKPPARSRRSLYPKDVDERVGQFAYLFKGQLSTRMSELYQRIGSDSKTTLTNRLRQGNLTVRDLIWINDYYKVNWNLIFESLREPKERFELYDDSESPAAVDANKKKAEKALTPKTKEKIEVDSDDPVVKEFAQLLGAG